MPASFVKRMVFLGSYFALVFLTLTSFPVFAETPPTDWPQWRGLHRDSISLEKDLHLDWTKTPPKEIWRARVGLGFSSFAVVADRVYTLGWSWRTAQDTVWCLDARTGQVLWSFSYPAASACWVDTGRQCPMWMGPRATPVVDAGQVYTVSADGQVFCLAADSGQVVWSKNLEKELHTQHHNWWFYAGSPLVKGDLLLVPVGKFDTALDKKTGAIRWCSGPEVAGLSSPVLLTYKNQDCFFTMSGSGGYLATLAEGQTLWTCKWGSGFDSADPLVIGDSILLSGAYAKISQLFKIGSPEPIWKNTKPKGDANLLPEVASPILYRDYVYSSTGYISGDVACVDPRDGSFKWTSAPRKENEKIVSGRKVSSEHVILAENTLINLCNKGEVALFAATPEACTYLGSTQLQPDTTRETWWTLPALSNGRLFCRSGMGTVVALDLRTPGRPGEFKIPTDPACLTGPIPYAEFTAPLKSAASLPAFQKPTAEDWTQYRGPRRDAVASTKGLALDWTKTPPKPLWRVNVGNGYSGVLTAGNRIYTMGWRLGETDFPTEYVWCLDARTGQVLWRDGYSCTFSGHVLDPSRGNAPACMGPRATLVLEGGRLFALTPAGLVNCYNADTGSRLWSKHLPKDFEITRPAFGFTGSPLILDHLLILPAGSAGLALDKKDGKLVWTTGKDRCGLASPMLFELNGQKRVALFSKDQLTVLDPADGKIIWEYPWPNAPVPTPASGSAPASAASKPAPRPVIDPLSENTHTDALPTPDGKLLVCTRGQGAALLDPATKKHLWQTRDLETWIGSPVLHEGFVYGPGPNNEELVCIDLKDGSTKWREQMDATQLTLLENKLVIQCRHGQVRIAKATPAGYQPLGQARLLDSDECWTPVTIVGKRLYCRSWDGDLLAVEIQ